MARPVIEPGSAQSTLYVSDTRRRGASWLRTHAGTLPIVAAMAGATTAALAIVSLPGGPVGQLLLAGALLAIAGQQVLAGLIAGVVILLTRTVRVGDRIRVHSGALGGTLCATRTSSAPPGSCPRSPSR